MSTKHDPVDIYAASRYGQHLAANQGDEMMREYARVAFAGVYERADDFARKVWDGWDPQSRAEYIEAFGLPMLGGTEMMPHPETIQTLVDGMVHGGVVEFVQVEDDGIYVYDETRY